jgi:hypothetical protein
MDNKNISKQNWNFCLINLSKLILKISIIIFLLSIKLGKNTDWIKIF